MLVRWSFSLVALSLMFALPALAQDLSAEEQVATTDESAAVELGYVVLRRHVLHDVREHVADLFERDLLGHVGIVRGD